MDKVEVMPSLQKPKKIVFRGSDGKMYPMLCKPHDDLRKDARLMDFNSMINKLLKSASESRRRQLCQSSGDAARSDTDNRYPHIRRHATQRRVRSIGVGQQHQCSQEDFGEGVCATEQKDLREWCEAWLHQRDAWGSLLMAVQRVTHQDGRRQADKPQGTDQILQGGSAATVCPFVQLGAVLMRDSRHQCSTTGS